MIILASLFCCALECAGASFQVTTTVDFNAGSLRQAITDANATPGTNTITFNIPGSGVQTISVSSQLPVITNTLVIDGTTQPGYTGTPLIALNGNGLFGSACGLVITGTGNTVRALSIQRFHFSGGTGHGILIQGGGSNVVAGCFIGVDATGTALQFNSGAGIWISNSVYNVIGGTNAADRNLICGNSVAGVLLSGGVAANNQVLGNYIGLGIFGTNAIGSTHGVTISNAPNNIIGGNVPGARNVISGQLDHEVILTGTGTVGNIIAGNYIGIRADGTALSANNANFDGISVNNAPGNTIGGIVAGTRNVISGNNNGINLLGSNTVGNVIVGNYIGTDASGSVKIPNHTGVIATALNGGFSVSNVIGGSVHGAGNVISGNVTVGVYINGSAGNTVQGNFIGTDATGLLALGNGASGTGGGLSVSGSGNIIGGGVPGAGNVISGNPSDGLDISVASLSDFSINNLVQGNWIGVGADGTTPLGNGLIGSGGRGLAVLGANSNLIGGFTAGSGNVVAYNGLDGVWLAGTFGYSGLFGSNNIVAGNTIYSNGAVVVWLGGKAAGVTLMGANLISSNSIFGNVYLGIDSGGDGPTANTPNGKSNYPILTLARQGSTDIDGTLNAGANCVYHIEFSYNSTEDNNPEFQFPLGAIDVPTDGAGNVTFHATFSYTVPRGMRITATATAACPGSPGETSEISHFTLVVEPVEGAAAGPTTYANHDISGTAGHPVSTFNGELFDLLGPDLVLDGPMPLLFQRYYAAFLKRDGLISGKLGDNWLHNFEMTLSLTTSNTINIINNRGRLITFTNSPGNFTLLGRQDIPFQLATNGGNYVLGDPRSQMLYTFDGTGKLITVADGRGNVQILSYAGGQLASVTDGLGRTLTFQYSGGFLTNVSDGVRSIGFVQTGNNLTSATDALGFITAYTYDPANALSGLMTAAMRPAGNIPFAQVFNTNGQVSTQTEAGVNTTSLIYSNNSTILIDPIGNIRVDVHTPTGELASFTDESNQVVMCGSNPTGQRTSVTDRLGQTTQIGYHAPSGKPAAITNADGAVTLFIYFPRTNSGVVFYDLGQTIYPDGTMESFTYDASGNVLTRTDQAGKVSSFGYNLRGQVLTETNPFGGAVTFTYDASGRLASRSDTDVGLTAFQYDSLNRLTNVMHPDGTSIQVAYDANDRLVLLKDERNHARSFAYDQNNRLVSATDANLQVTHFAYDGRDRLMKVTDRLGHNLGFSYDTLDHVASVTNGNGNVTTFSYDSRRRLASVTDPAAKVWTVGHDNEAVPVLSINPLGQADSRAVNSLGYPVAFSNALGQVSRVVRDFMQRTTNIVDEIGRTNGFAYDARGLLASTTAPLIGAAVYQRNNFGLLSGITGLNGEQWNFTYTPMGRLQSLADPLNRSNVYSYDSRGRLERIAFADGVVCSNSYDSADNATRRQFTGSPDLQFTYDSLNRLASANDLSFAYDPEGRITNTVSSGVNQGAAYDAGGRLTSIAYQNGAFTVNYTYDTRDRLTQVTDTLTGTQINFNYDDAGRLTGITRPNGVNGTYTYDTVGRLARIQEGAIIDIQYGYDAAGEVTNANFTAPLDPANFLAPAISAFTYDPAHQIKNSGYVFDARGRQMASPGHGYQWDGASRLIGIDGVALAYNGTDDIVTRTTNGVTTRFFYNHALDLTPIVAERNENTSQIQRYYVWTPGGRLLYLIDAANGNAVRFFHFDRVGSTLAMTAANSSVTDTYCYSPYGVLLGRTGTNPQPFTYIGEFGVRSEAAANLYQMRARYYDPALARFISCDPAAPDPGNPRSLDPYSYAWDDPVRFIDRTGRSPEDYWFQTQVLKGANPYKNYIGSISSDDIGLGGNNRFDDRATPELALAAQVLFQPDNEITVLREIMDVYDRRNHVHVTLDHYLRNGQLDYKGWTRVDGPWHRDMYLAMALGQGGGHVRVFGVDWTRDAEDYENEQKHPSHWLDWSSRKVCTASDFVITPVNKTGLKTSGANPPDSSGRRDEVMVVNGVKLEFKNHEQIMDY